MMRPMIEAIAVILLCLFIVSVAYFLGYRDGDDAGARQMARHILNPAFRTDRFVSIVEQEKGNYKGWRITEDGYVHIYEDGVTFDGHLGLPDLEGK